MTVPAKEHSRSRITGAIEVMELPAFANIIVGSETCTASSTAGGTFTYNAIDGNMATRWASNTGTLPHWWQIDLGSAKGCTRYAGANYNGGDSAIRTWILKGSNNGTDFEDIHSVSNDQWSTGAYKYWTISSPGSYRYYRIHITASTDGYANIGQFQLSL